MGLEGLLVGLGEGMKSGVESYNQARDRKMREKQYQQGLLKEGYQETAEGGLIQTPEAIAKTQFEQNQKNLTQKREAMQHGLIPVKDEKGNVIDFARDPNYINKNDQLRDLQIQKYQTELKTAPSEQKFKSSGELRKEFQGLPEVKDYKNVKTSYAKVKSAAENPSAAGDLSMVFGYMKMLDPASTVREGEQAQAQNAAGVPERIRNLYNKAMTGERLSPEQRQDFINQAENIMKAQEQGYTKQKTQYGRLAKNYNLMPEDVIGVDDEPRGLVKQNTQKKPYENLSDAELDAELAKRGIKP